MRVSVSTPGLLSLRRDLQAIHAAGLGKDMGKRLRATARPLRGRIAGQAETDLPKRGGYNQVMSRSIRARTSVREDRLTALISVTIYSAGQKQRRDIVRIDEGRLRHPVYGRSRKLKRGSRAGTRIPNPWSVTTVTPGFASKPIDALGPQVSRAGREIVAELMIKLKG